MHHASQLWWSKRNIRYIRYITLRRRLVETCFLLILASYHSKMAKDDISYPTHACNYDNENSGQRCHQSDSHAAQSQHPFQVQSRSEDHCKQNDCHTSQEVGTQTSAKVATRDVGTQSQDSGKETRSIAVQTEPVETPDLQQSIEVPSHKQHLLPCVPLNDVQVPHQSHRRLEIPPSLSGRTENALLPPPAIVWQSTVTKIVTTTLPPSIGWAPSWRFNDQPSIQSSDSDEVVTHQADARRNIPHM